MHILDYLESRSESDETALMWYFHNLLTTYPEFTPAIHFNTPFYTANRWLCYLSLQKKGGIELCFVLANKFENHLEYLDFKKRKQVAGITFNNTDEINAEIIDLLMTEALRIDKTLKKRK